MQALQFNQTGSLEHLSLVEVEKPKPAAGEVLIQIKAAGLNPSDAKNVLGIFPYTTLPRIPGRDFAGVVIEGSAEWQGRAVWGSGKGLGFTQDGTHAEFLCLPLSALSATPSNLDFAAAASCGVPFLTALEAIERSGVTAGTKVLVVGALGAVGYAAIQLAKVQGAQVLAAVRKPEHAQQLQAEGFATLLLDDEKQLPEAVQAHFGAEADVIFDTTGFWLAAVIHALAVGGRVVVIAAPAGGMVQVPVLPLYRRGGSIIGVNSLLHDVTASAQMLTRLSPLFESGQLKVKNNLCLLPLSEGISAYQKVLESSEQKIILQP